MFLIIEHGCREGECAGHSHVSERYNNDDLGVLGLYVADDAALIAKVRDFRDSLGGLDGNRFLLSREMLDHVGCQSDLERHCRLQDRDEIASLLWFIEHLSRPFCKSSDSIIIDDREYGSTEPFLILRTRLPLRTLRATSISNPISLTVRFALSALAVG